MPGHTEPFDEQTRRSFLGRGVAALGSIALSAIAQPSPALALPHFAPRARRVIFLYMSGGPSQLETFDHKPKLIQHHGQTMPTSVTRGQPVAQLQGKELRIMGPRYPFRRVGRAGQEMTTLAPLGAILVILSGGRL